MGGGVPGGGAELVGEGGGVFGEGAGDAGDVDEAGGVGGFEEGEEGQGRVEGAVVVCGKGGGGDVGVCAGEAVSFGFFFFFRDGGGEGREGRR